jgi:hypothetical protein
MRNALFAAAAAFILLAAAPGGARACGRANGNYSGLVTALLVVGSVDSAFTLWDAGSAAASHHPSAAYGVLELLATLPQAIATVPLLGTSAAWYPVWMFALSGHAVWTIASSEEPEGPHLHQPSSGTDLKSRAVVSLGTTFVPLGQFSQPGVGLVGRF